MADPAQRPRSYTYHTALDWMDARAGKLSSEDKAAFRVASPPEFKGEAGTWTPEDLFVASVEACTMTTFLSFAERKGIELLGYASRAEGTIEIIDGGFRFTSITIRPRITVDASQVDLAKQVLHDAHEKCIISNSMACPVTVEGEVVAG